MQSGQAFPACNKGGKQTSTRASSVAILFLQLAAPKDVETKASLADCPLSSNRRFKNKAAQPFQNLHGLSVDRRSSAPHHPVAGDTFVRCATFARK